MVAALLLVNAALFGQSFDGVPISGDLPTAISRFKEKGYSLTKYIENGVIMKGKVAGESVELFIFNTVKSKVVFKISVYFEEQQAWRSLKSQYQRVLDILKGKYGDPDNSYTDFEDPYFEGDGYEMSAVQLEKCNYVAYWLKKDNLSLAIEISKWKQVNITYENDANMAIQKQERSQIQKNSF